MLGRKGWTAVGLVALVMGVFLAVSWPRGLDVSLSTGPGPTSAPITLPEPTSEPEVLNEFPPAPPTTEPPLVDVARGPGRTLRVGTARPVPLPATVADARGPEIPIFSAPGDAEPGDWMDNPTWEGLPVVFLVMGRQGDWLNVQVSMRPNMATAWVRAGDVTTRQVNQRIEIDIAARQLTVYDTKGKLFDAPVAPGLSSAPTPTGSFFVDGVVALSDTSGPYGAYQISVAAFSNVHYSFGGGNGQIAIHGTNNPALIGSPASNGCVRMTNEDISQVTTMVPLGAPVQIY
ncbi:MAG: L,D-transpeptidase [Acidimicrobiales bacterium]